MIHPGPRPRSRAGFTLVEMLVVVAIIAIMGTVGVTVMRWLIPDSAMSSTAQQIATITEQARDEASLLGRTVYLEYRLGEREDATQYVRAIRSAPPGQEEEIEELEDDLQLTRWMALSKDVRIAGLLVGDSEDIQSGYYSFAAEADGSIAGHVVLLYSPQNDSFTSVVVSGLLNDAKVVDGRWDTVFLTESDF